MDVDLLYHFCVSYFIPTNIISLYQLKFHLILLMGIGVSRWWCGAPPIKVEHWCTTKTKMSLGMVDSLIKSYGQSPTNPSDNLNCPNCVTWMMYDRTILWVLHHSLHSLKIVLMRTWCNTWKWDNISSYNRDVSNILLWKLY